MGADLVNEVNPTFAAISCIAKRCKAAHSFSPRLVHCGIEIQSLPRVLDIVAHRSCSLEDTAHLTSPRAARTRLQHAMVAPTVTLTHLNRADGSATYTHQGYSIIGAVNGPIEVQRRDELPEEAAIEVNVRPAMGVGSMYMLAVRRKGLGMLTRTKALESDTSKLFFTTRFAASS